MTNGFTADARQIAINDAAYRLGTLGTRAEADAALAAAQTAGDPIMVAALVRTITDRWPTRREVDYDARLDAANLAIIRTVTTASQDAMSRRLGQDRDRGAITDEYFRPRYEAALYGFADRLDTILEEAVDVHTRAQRDLAARVNGLLAPPAGDVAEQTLFELRVQRTWDRTKQLLDSLPAEQLLGEVAQMVPAAVTPEARRVFVDEIPDYLRTRGVDAERDFVTDLLAESDPVAIELGRAANAASAYTAVIRYSVEQARRLLQPEFHAELHALNLESYATGRDGRLITVGAANLSATGRNAPGRLRQADVER